MWRVVPSASAPGRCAEVRVTDAAEERPTEGDRGWIITQSDK